MSAAPADTHAPAPDLLLQHPVAQVDNLAAVSYPGKHDFSNVKPIPGKQLRIRTAYNATGHYVSTDWTPLTDWSDDYLRREAPTCHPNPRTAYKMTVEADAADYFKQEILAPVLSKFTEYPQVFHQAEMEPPAGGSGKCIGSVFYITDPREDGEESQYVVLAGDYRRNSLKPGLWLSGNIEKDSTQVAISRELRGYAIEYQVPHIFIFDMETLLIVQFYAKKAAKLESSDCPVDCWIYRRAEADTDSPAEFLRDVMYRFIVHGLRRASSLGCALRGVGGLVPKERMFSTGEPLWQRKDGKLTVNHPYGYYREVYHATGALAWKMPTGEWYLPDGSNMVFDSRVLWWLESSSDESMDDSDYSD